MKYTARILLLLIAVLIVVMVVNSTSSTSTPETTVDNQIETNDLTSQTIERCYAHKDLQEIDEETTLYGFSFLRATINGMQVEGSYENYPAEKDAMYGSFMGEVNVDANSGAYLLTTLYAYSAEGMENTEEKYFILNTDQAYVGYGQMSQNDNGLYMYEDPTMVDFTYTIPMVSCEKYDKLYNEFSELRG